MKLLGDLNRLILTMAPVEFDAAEFAPSTDVELFQHAATGAAVKVWSGASEATIYRDAHVNHAFRAWHDSCHIAGWHSFTLAGERGVCERQIAQAREMFPGLPEWIVAAIRSEVVGQAEFYAINGFFPVDQAAFFLQDVGLRLTAQDVSELQ